jgi:ribosomal protein L21
VTSFYYRRRKGYSRTTGHKGGVSVLNVLEVEYNGQRV